MRPLGDGVRRGAWRPANRTASMGCEFFDPISTGRDQVLRAAISSTNGTPPSGDFFDLGRPNGGNRRPDGIVRRSDARRAARMRAV